MKTEEEIRKRLDELIEEEHGLSNKDFLLRGDRLQLKQRALAWVLEIPGPELLKMRGYKNDQRVPTAI